MLGMSTKEQMAATKEAAENLRYMLLCYYDIVEDIDSVSCGAVDCVFNSDNYKKTYLEALEGAENFLMHERLIDSMVAKHL